MGCVLGLGGSSQKAQHEGGVSELGSRDGNEEHNASGKGQFSDRDRVGGEWRLSSVGARASSISRTAGGDEGTATDCRLQRPGGALKKQSGGKQAGDDAN